MKKIILLMLFISIVSCKAQIIPMNNDHVETPDGAHLKDTENFLNKFVGTWKYQNGNEQFIIILKKENDHFYKTYYKDILYGEYKYISSSGNTLINTLDKIDFAYPSKSYHNISGASLISNNLYVKCNDCNPGEFRVKSFFDDSDRKGLIGTGVIFRYINPTTIKVLIIGSKGKVLESETDNLPDQLRVPSAEYTMTKQ
ncbi:hypothetical protein GCM10023210_04830 [Chryseobacterium ginsengisoli]|uniref:DUF6705 domain-containing protein n=1 Tax=Chryseobacterium ginsengisoli TaxID=363853 RepID=A0ABP9LWK6_9FLAO